MKNPYKFLGVNVYDSMEKIKRKFKQIVLKVHPDKGGSKKLFELVKHAYVSILEHRKSLNTRDHNQLKTSYGNKNESVSPINIFGKNKFNNDKFNQTFDKVRMEHINDHGYGTYMTTENRKSETDDSSRTGQITQFKKQNIVVYKKQETVSDLQHNYEELGGEVPQDYSSNVNSDINYTDYKKAHTEQHGIDELSKYGRKEQYNSLDHLKASREKPLSQYEKMVIAEQIRKERHAEEEEESLRLQRFLEHKNKVKNHFNYVNNFIAPTNLRKSNKKVVI